MSRTDEYNQAARKRLDWEESGRLCPLDLHAAGPCFAKSWQGQVENEAPYAGAIMIQVGFTMRDTINIYIWMPAPAMPYAPWIIRGLLFRTGYRMEEVSELWAEILNTGSAPEHSQINMEI